MLPLTFSSVAGTSISVPMTTMMPTISGGKPMTEQMKTSPVSPPLGTALSTTASSSATPTIAAVQKKIVRDGEYNSKEDVSSYIRQFKGALPRNFITKREARALGWQGGPLEPYAPGKSIGGDRFGNYEGQLPPLNGGFYNECDIDTRGRPRVAKRLVFTNKGQRIYYTEDHYRTFKEVK